MTWFILSEYSKESREAKVYDTQDGFMVEMYEDGRLVEARSLFGHNQHYAEDCAENWIEGIIA